MALIFCDGFDHYDYLVGHPDHSWALDKWDSVECPAFNTSKIVQGGGRFGTAGWSQDGCWCSITKAVPSGPQNRVTMGVSFNPTNGCATANHNGNGVGILSTWNSGGYDYISLIANETGQLMLCHNLNNYYATFDVLAWGPPVRTNTYQYLELQIDVATTTAKVWMNEVEVISYTGAEIGAAVQAVRIGAHTSWIRTDFTGEMHFDDFYLTDGTGSYNTGNLGDVRVQELFPIADWDKEWVPDPGPDHFEMVNDPYNLIDDTLTIISTKTLNAKDTFTFPSVSPTAGDVKAVALNIYQEKLDSGARGVKATGVVSPPGVGLGTYGDGTETFPGGGWAIYQSYMERDPDGNQWTIATVNASKFGPKLTT